MKFHTFKTQNFWLPFLCCAASLFGGTVGRPAWNTPPSIQRLILDAPADLNPTLPAPRLVREPEFTIGYDNTLFWPADSLESVETASGRTLLFYEIQARYSVQGADSTLWGFVNAGTGSAMFVGLPEGPSIEYRLRYYSRDAGGGFELSNWSDPQISIQDSHAPQLGRWDVIRLQKAVPIAWVIGRTLTFRVTASDPPAGQVMEMVVHEKSGAVDDTVIFDIVPPKPDVDTVFSSYSLRTAEHEPVTLTFWVKDLSGQTSTPVVLTLFWMPDEENRMFSFPNPFNPSRQEIAVIQVPTSELQTAKVFDPFGNCVRTLRKAAASNAFFEWDGRNERGDLVANGGYLCVIEGQKKMYCKIAVLR
jgi:hypothetical protein